MKIKVKLNLNQMTLFKGLIVDLNHSWDLQKCKCEIILTKKVSSNLSKKIKLNP